MRHFEVGDIVRIVAPGSRETNGEARLVPAIVLGQYQDGSLALYCFHFQGSPLLANGLRQDLADVAFSHHDIMRRLEQLEKEVAALGGRKHDPARFQMADDVH